MQDRPVKIPGVDHPIAIGQAGEPVSVWIDGMQIARSNSALALSEKGYAVVYYIPREDIAMDRLKPGSKRTYCPYKGEATHFDINTGGNLLNNAAWSYDDPFDAVRRIRGHIAFYKDLPNIEIRGA